MNKTRTIIIDGIEIQTSLTGVEIAGLVQRNKELQQQCKKQKEVIDKAKSLNEEISHIIYEDFLEENVIGCKYLYERVKKQLDILKEVE